MHDDHHEHHDDTRRLERWLAAEAELAGTEEGAGAEPAALDAADRALFSLFEVLPPVEPPAGFARRVLDRLAEEGFAARAATGAATGVPHPWMAHAWRLAVSLAVVLTGCTVLLLPAVARLIPAEGWSVPFRWWSAALTGLGETLGDVLAVWQDMAWLSDVLGRAAATPTGALSLALALAVAAVAFRLLLELDARDRSWSHAETI